MVNSLPRVYAEADVAGDSLWHPTADALLPTAVVVERRLPTFFFNGVFESC